MAEYKRNVMEWATEAATHTHVYTHMHECTCTCVSALAHMHTGACMHEHGSMRMSTCRTCTHANVHVHMRTCRVLDLTVKQPNALTKLLN